MSYRVGVIGCTGVGTQHASGLVGLTDAELVAGCDLSSSVLERFQEHWAEEWPDMATYTDHRQMLAEARLDIVTVATSDHKHADLVVDAAQAGVKGIFCEKPMATSIADADRMLSATDANDTILSIDHTRRWQPLWVETKQQVEDGVIGKVQNIIGTLNGGRAMLFRNGTHLIDAICYFSKGNPDWVFAQLEDGFEGYAEYRGDGGHDPKTEPSAHGYIHFDNGVRGIYVGGSKQTPSGFGLEIVGTEGRIRINSQQSILEKEDKISSIEGPTWETVGIPAGIQELVGLMRKGGTPVSPGHEAYQVVKVIIGFLQSQQRGNIRVDL